MKNYRKEDLLRAQNAIRKIATNNNLSESVVRCEIMEAMEIGMSNPDPSVQEKWKNISVKSGKVNGKVTSEELILWVMEEIEKRKN